MFYLYHGGDREKARARAREVIDILRKKRPDAEFFRITSDIWNPANFEEYFAGQGLFERKFIVFADGVLENKEAKDWISERLKEIAESENAFVFLEEKIDADTLKNFKKFVAKAEKFDLENKKGRNFSAIGGKSFSLKDFNIFSLVDAFGGRDKKKAWIFYREAMELDIPLEEINGILFWQVKAMILAKDGKDPTETELAPFVFSKSKRYAGNFSSEELRKLSSDIVSIYHDAHRGLCDFEVGLEKLILTRL